MVIDGGQKFCTNRGVIPMSTTLDSGLKPAGRKENSLGEGGEATPVFRPLKKRPKLIGGSQNFFRRSKLNRPR